MYRNFYILVFSIVGFVKRNKTERDEKGFTRIFIDERPYC